MVSDFQALLSDFWGNFHVLFHYYLANGCCMPNRLAFTQHKEELQTPRRLRQSLTYRQSCPLLQGLPKQLYFFFPHSIFFLFEFWISLFRNPLMSWKIFPFFINCWIYEFSLFYVILKSSFCRLFLILFYDF